MSKQAMIKESIENFARTLLQISNPRPMMEDFGKAIEIAMESFSAMGIDIAGIDREQIKKQLQTKIVFSLLAEDYLAGGTSDKSISTN